jgi:hypothetical protein
MPDDVDPIPALRCANHPNRETMLRCNRCDKPICPACAVRTPVGYRCRECVRGQQAVYYTGQPQDPFVGGVIALILGGVFGALAYAFLGVLALFAFIVALLAGPAAGSLMAEAVRRAVGRRRSRSLRPVAAASCALGVLLGGLALFAGTAILAGAPFAVALDLLPALLFRLDVLLFAALAASTIYARLI